MVHRSVVGAPVVMETVEQERLIHAQGIAESGICTSRANTAVLIYGEKSKCTYRVKHHGGAFSMNRVYTIDDDDWFISSLMVAESFWPTDLEMHICAKCHRMAPGLASLILRPDGVATSLICHLAAACGDIQSVLWSMHEKEVFLRAIGIEVFPVWVDSEKYQVPKSIWCPPLTLKEQHA